MAKAAKLKPAPARKSEMVIFDCEQGSPEWFLCRMGIPTASEFGKIMADGRNGEESRGRAQYMRRLAGEIITGQPAEESYKSMAMIRGNAMEPEIRANYAMEHGVRLVRPGFVRNGQKGCSPDSLVGADGILEIKTMAPELLIELYERGAIPAGHRPQVQGCMWVCEREWGDIRFGYSGMKPMEFRMYRDESYIKQLSDAVEVFNFELKKMVDKIRGMR